MDVFEYQPCHVTKPKVGFPGTVAAWLGETEIVCQLPVLLKGPFQTSSPE